MPKVLKKARKELVRKDYVGSALDPTSKIHFSVGPVSYVKVKDFLDGHGMVSLEEAKRNGKFPKVDETMVPPGTHFRVMKSVKRVQCLVTVMPNGTHIAWAACGVCHEYFTLCRCRSGISADRSVEHIFDSITARLAGEEFDYRHKNYEGSLTRAARERRRGGISSRIIAPRDLSKIPKKVMPGASPKVLRKAAETQKPKTKTLRRGNDVSTVMTAGTLDIGKLNTEAAKVQDAAEAEFTKRIKKANQTKNIQPKKIIKRGNTK